MQFGANQITSVLVKFALNSVLVAVETGRFMKVKIIYTGFYHCKSVVSFFSDASKCVSTIDRWMSVQHLSRFFQLTYQPNQSLTFRKQSKSICHFNQSVIHFNKHWPFRKLYITQNISSDIWSLFQGRNTKFSKNQYKHIDCIVIAAFNSIYFVYSLRHFFLFYGIIKST